MINGRIKAIKILQGKARFSSWLAAINLSLYSNRIDAHIIITIIQQPLRAMAMASQLP
jgi:hypothetical protein